jgi:hypothetical protein
MYLVIHGIPYVEPDTATCPVCSGRPISEERVEGDDEVTVLVTICEVCDRTGRVSPDLARVLWNHRDTPASA